MLLGFSGACRLAASRNLNLVCLTSSTHVLSRGLASLSAATSADPRRVPDDRPADRPDSRTGQALPGRRVKRPKRIERSPTDLLDALSSTVGKDHTGPHYRYIDDPFFIPASANSRKIFALSKESGRKSARYIVKKYPDLFKKPKPQPELPVFLASSQLDYQIPENPSVENLTERMRCGGLVAAFQIYQALRKNDPAAVPPEIQQELLERLCCHNGEDALDSDLLDEKWFAYYIQQKDVRRRWTVGGAADQVFKDIEPKTPEAYSAMICAMAKYLHVEGAGKMFEEMREQGYPVSVQVFNAMLRITPMLKDSIESRWEMTMSLLSQMNHQGLAPNLQIFNSVLEVIAKIAMWKRSRTLALSVFSEMKRCGIEPSLASYHYLLQIFCRERGPVSHILHDILRELKGETLTMRDARDTLFFVTAMETASRHLQDPVVGKRVYDLALEGNNSLFLADAHKEQLFYGNFLKVLVVGESVENFFKLYDEIVPMTYVPDSLLFQEMIKMVEFHDQLDHLPRIWSDAMVFGLALKENILEGFLEVLVDNHRDELKEQFAAIALDVKTRIEAQSSDRVNRVPWSGPVISSVCLLLVRNGQHDVAWEVISNFLDKKTESYGFPSQEALTELVDALAVDKVNAPKVKRCLVLAADLGFVELTQRAEELAQTLQLPEKEVQHWRMIGGAESVAFEVTEEVRL